MLKIPPQYKSFESIKLIEWVNIFAKWKEGEAWQDGWHEHWISRGFETWDEWRRAYVRPINPTSLRWFLFEIKEPFKDVPLIWGVPTKSWSEMAYEGETSKQLKDVVKLEEVADNYKVAAIKRNFPKNTMLTGLIWENKIILIEGMNRAIAIASWAERISFIAKVFIALAAWEKPDFPILGGNYKNKLISD